MLRHALVMIGTYAGYGRGLLHGVIRFADESRDWVFWVVHAGDPNTVLTDRAVDGVLVHSSDPDVVAAVKALGRPVVNLSNALPEIGAPRVSVDNAAVGRLGADYFLDRGFRQFAFAGDTQRAHARERWEAFRGRLQSRRLPVALIDAWPNTALRVEAGRWLEAWKQGATEPLAVLAVNDQAGRIVSDACRDLGLCVPEAVSILGVDNDELDCNLSTPPLSSIQLPTERIGYEAMQLLQRLVERGPRPTDPILLPPVQVVSRQSTDLLAVADEDVRTLVRYIRDHAGEPISLKQFFAKATAARSTVERRFRAMLGRSPMEEAVRVHIERAKDLLATTDLPMGDVARQSGFASNAQFSRVFRQQAGLTPTAYRGRFRVGPGRG